VIGEDEIHSEFSVGNLLKSDNFSNREGAEK
jgi:hypothetical protein